MRAQTEENLSDGARAILAAAETLFSERGYDAVSVKDIVGRAGGSRANIFHHFGSKEGLYLAVMRHACRRAAPLLEVLVDPGQPFSERLAQFAREHLRFMFEHAGAVRLVLRELLKGDQRRSRELVEQHIVGDNLSCWIKVLTEAQQCGDIREGVDPAAAALLLVGANVFLFQCHELLRHVPGVRLTGGAGGYNDRMVQILLHGLLGGAPLRARGGQASRGRRRRDENG